MGACSLSDQLAVLSTSFEFKTEGLDIITLLRHNISNIYETKACKGM
jgi:hypothetical protein